MCFKGSSTYLKTVGLREQAIWSAKRMEGIYRQPWRVIFLVTVSRQKTADLEVQSLHLRTSLTILLQECKRQQMSAGQDPFIRDVTGQTAE